MSKYIDLDDDRLLQILYDEVHQAEIVYKKLCGIANAEPVRRGKWKAVCESEITGWNPAFAGCDPIGGYQCSNCGAEAILDCNDEFVLSDYCPNCGSYNGEEGEDDA